VLLIDLDFQASLSSMAFPNEEWLPPSKQDSLATKLISGDIGSGLIPGIAKNVPLTSDDGTEVGQLAIIPSFYDLAQAENRLLIEWLLNVPQKQSIIRTLLEKCGFTRVKLTDVRYTLARILHSQSVQKAYDLVILDCPPRLSTGAVQAFCASSHLLIPTIFDRPSGEAVISFHEQIETLKRGGICPELKYLGVVGTKWNGNQTNPREWLDQMTTLLSGTELNVLSEDKFLPEAAAIVKYADDGIAYLAVPAVRNNASVRDRIGNLATYVAHRMGIPRPHDVTWVAAQ
jgi:chromosome partitioning protein